MPPERQGGLVRRLTEAIEDRTGLTLADKSRVDLLEATADDHRALLREHDLLGWTVLDAQGSSPQDLTPHSRRAMVAKARTVWRDDPLAGAAVELMNNFVFGRGVPKPRAKDPEVQEVLDEAWDDTDNQRTLTSYEAQVALGTDLMLQSNVFLLMFDQGDDGKVKLGLLNHDEVENVVRDPDNRLRVLYYVAKHKRGPEWDFAQDREKPDLAGQIQPKATYYEDWRNVAEAEEQGIKIPRPPKDKRGEGRVRHIAVNRTVEQAFGVPTFRRLLRWWSAFNTYMEARVDIAQAAAAFIMRRKVKGTPNQVARLASKAISRRSELAGLTGTGDSMPQAPPRGGSILTENENVQHEALSLNTNAAGAMQDAQMIRAQISAATFPQHYLGDSSNASLASATALELPVLKRVEAMQEVFEGVFRWFLDRVIERAVDARRLDLEPQAEPQAEPLEPNQFGPEASTDLTAAHEDKAEDEGTTQRDLSYEFSMPSPLRRMMGDLVNSVANIAKTFDPNGTNVELSRILLTVALGEGLEMQDPAEAVERIFPEGYQDPALAAAQQQGQPVGPVEDTGAFGPDGQRHTEDNPYGAPMKASSPEENPYGLTQAVGRNGQPVVSRRRLEELRFRDLSDTAQRRWDAIDAEVEELFEREVGAAMTETLDRMVASDQRSNGGGL